jgi:hypothetical protein
LSRGGGSPNDGEQPRLQRRSSFESRFSIEDLHVRLLQNILRVIGVASAQRQSPREARRVKLRELLFQIGSVHHGRSSFGRVDGAVI